MISGSNPDGPTIEPYFLGKRNLHQEKTFLHESEMRTAQREKFQVSHGKPVASLSARRFRSCQHLPSVRLEAADPDRQDGLEVLRELQGLLVGDRPAPPVPQVLPQLAPSDLSVRLGQLQEHGTAASFSINSLTLWTFSQRARRMKSFRLVHCALGQSSSTSAKSSLGTFTITL